MITSQRICVDESGDSDELQALFDRISAAPLRPRLEVVAAVDAGGDSDDLQALFDSIVDQAGPGRASVPNSVHSRIGRITRRLNDALREFGNRCVLRDEARSPADAYVLHGYRPDATGQAPSRVLCATETARLIQDRLAAQAEALDRRWRQLYQGELAITDFKALAEETRAFLAIVPRRTRETNAQLQEVVMAHHPQDATGDVITRLVEAVLHVEDQLLRVLLETMPEPHRSATGEASPTGQPFGPQRLSDAIPSRQQVDELLDSLGF